MQIVEMLESPEERDIYLYDLKPKAEKLKANFITDVSSGNAPLSVSFIDMAKEIPKTWHWDFGDGKSSTQQNPTHTFYSAGSPTVNLTITYLYYTNSTTATISVLDELTSPLPIANFSANLTSSYAPLTVQFNDTSQNASGWNWDFGDGANSTERSPTHIFTGVGNYNVNLTVSNPNGIDSKTIVITVMLEPTICGPCINDDDNGGGGGGGTGGSPKQSGQNAKFDFQGTSLLSCT